MGKWFRTLCVAVGILPLVSTWAISAQDGVSGLSLVAEYSLGELCPDSGVMSSDGSIVWALTWDCIHDQGIYVQGYFVADGQPVGEPIGPFDTDIASSDLSWMDGPKLTLQADGTLTADLVDTMTTGTTASFTVDTATGTITPLTDSPRILTPEAILASVPGFTGFTDMLKYNRDRTLALTQDDQSLYVFAVPSGEVVMRAAPPGGLDYVGSWFGPAGTMVYAWVMAEPGNYDNDAGTLYAFGVPGGDVVSETEYAMAPYYVSPDGQRAVVSIRTPGVDAESLAVMAMATGQMSEALSTQTGGAPLDTCKNTGRSAVNMGWSSNDPTRQDFVWLPDGSGFITLNSDYFWQGGCKSNDSRLRVYAVTGQ